MDDDAANRRVLVCCHVAHRHLGPGYPETVYQRALTRELEKAGFTFKREASLPVMYDGEEIDRIHVDFLVEGIPLTVVARPSIDKQDIARTLAGVKAAVSQRGLIVNFGLETVQTKHILLSPKA